MMLELRRELSMSSSFKNKLKAVYHLLKLKDQVELATSIVAAAVIANGSLSLPNVEKVLLVVLFGFFSLTGTIVFNQYHEIEIDRINKPQRPLPSGQLRKEDAFLIVVLSYVLSILLAVFLGFIYMLMAIANILISIFYSVPVVGTRRNILLSTVLVSLGYAIISFVAGWSIYRPVTEISWWLLAFLFITDVGEVFTKDYRDIEGDKRGGLTTLPILVGYRKAAKINMFIYLTPFIVLLIASLTGLVNIKFSVLSIYCILSGAYAFSLLLKNESTKNAVLCYRITTSNYFIIRILMVWASI